MNIRPFPIAVLLAAVSTCLAVPPAAADVVVISNRTDRAVGFIAAQHNEPIERYTLAAGDLTAVPVTAALRVAFYASPAGEDKRQYELPPNTIYFLAADQRGAIDLHGIGFAPTDRKPRPNPWTAEQIQRLSASGTIPVKILVDEEEPAPPQQWRQRLRERVKATSDLLEKHCRMKLEIVEFESWKTDDRLTDFGRSMREFELEVDPGPARLAIGFTSQYQLVKGRTNLGGTRGPLHSHILIREWSKSISESERVEVLLHEIGHYLGAVHSPEQDSVMRPVLGDRQSRRVDFRVKFDPLNMLAINLLAEQVRARDVRELRQVSIGTKIVLRDLYTQLAKALEKDPAAPRYVQLIEMASVSPLTRGTRSVVRSIVVAAAANHKLPDRPVPGELLQRIKGDRLTELYFRQAADTAGRLPPEMAGSAMLLGLGIALDRGTSPRGVPQSGGVSLLVESDNERKERLSVLGRPTMHGREDLVQHFVLSASMSVSLGSDVARSAGIVKEMLDARGKSGFSFADLAADMAGVYFAERLRGGELSPKDLAQAFTVKDFVPAPAPWPENLTAAQFAEQYGSVADRRFAGQITAIRRHVRSLPGYRAGTVDEPPIPSGNLRPSSQ